MDWGRVGLGVATMGQSETLGAPIRALMGGKGGGGGFDTGMLEKRRAEIDKFSQDLGAARANYSTALGNMYNSAFQRFIPAQQARMASRGLSMGGGAYNASLGREVARYQSEMEPQIYQAEREDLAKVDAARGGLFGSGFDASNAAMQGAANRRNAMMGMIGQLGGTVVGGMMGGPPGAAMGSSVGGMLGSGGRTGTMSGGKRVWDAPMYNPNDESTYGPSWKR